MPTPANPLSSLGGIGIYLLPKDGDAFVREPVIAKILPISATTTTLQFFADPGQVRRIRGYVYSEANRTSLENSVKVGSTVNFTNDKGSQGNFVVLSLSLSRQQALNYSDAMYTFQAELIQQ